jgi:hypothetical protein
MRSLFIVLVPEGGEGALLPREIRCRGPRGFGFQRAMHALVRAVLLRRGGPNALMLDAEPEPPHVELSEPMQAVDPIARAELPVEVRRSRDRSAPSCGSAPCPDAGWAGAGGGEPRGCAAARDRRRC